MSPVAFDQHNSSDLSVLSDTSVVAALDFEWDNEPSVKCLDVECASASESDVSLWRPSLAAAVPRPRGVYRAGGAASFAARPKVQT